MSAHLDETTLNDLAEGLLGAPERERAESHLAECAACRSELDRQRALLAELAALPRDVEPDEDLRPAIRAAARRRPARTAGPTPRRRAVSWPLAAAAAVVLMAATAAVTMLLLGRGDGRTVATAPADTAPGGVGLAAFRSEERGYERQAEDLASALERHRAALEPETVELVEENLRTIDRALREARAALEADPASPLVRDMVLDAHEKRIEVLRWANQLASET